MLLSQTANFDLSTLLGWGTSVLEWFITSMTTIFSFFMAHPALFIWMIVSLIGSAFIFLRKLF